jgi:hypothetical protein
MCYQVKIILEKIMRCTKPIRLTENVNRLIYPDGLDVPCGKCTNCRVQKREEWSLRCLHELTAHEDSIFVTLTYANEHVPKNMSLKKKHLQDFLKRLRKYISPDKIRYFACGEYGELSERPHYHLIIYGIGFRHIEFIKKAWPFCDWNVPQIANASFGLVEYESIRYVAQYIDKKLSGFHESVNHTYLDRENVFRLCSMGLGRDYVIANKERLEKDLHCTHRGKRVSLPRYYLNKLEIDKKRQAELRFDLDSEYVEELTGVSGLDFDTAYKLFKNDDLFNLVHGRLSDDKQREKNLIDKLEYYGKKKL